MATSQQFLVCDSSTLANFKQWAQAISGFFTTAGWLQSTDTGQVNWSTIAAVPGNGAYVYEIWQPNDGLTNFYLKIEYGNVTGSTNCPTIRLTVSTTTNGAGTPTGFVTVAQTTTFSPFTPASAVTLYECDFSGAAGRIGAMLWRNGANGCQQLFAVERSVNSSGSYTGAHVTVITLGNPNSSSTLAPAAMQQTLLLGVGSAPTNGNRVNAVGSGYTCLCARVPLCSSQSNSSAFNGSLCFDTVAPALGLIDYPLTMVGVGAAADFADGVTFTVTLYGATRTYMPSKSSWFAYSMGTAGLFATALRYD